MDSAEEVMDSASATSDVDSATEVSEVEEDLKELKLFLGQAQRPRVKELLQDDIKKLESEASAAAAASKAPEMPVVREETVASAPQQKRLPTKKLDTYGDPDQMDSEDIIGDAASFAQDSIDAVKSDSEFLQIVNIIKSGNAGEPEQMDTDSKAKVNWSGCESDENIGEIAHNPAKENDLGNISSVENLNKMISNVISDLNDDEIRSASGGTESSTLIDTMTKIRDDFSEEEVDESLGERNKVTDSDPEWESEEPKTKRARKLSVGSPVKSTKLGRPTPVHEVKVVKPTTRGTSLKSAAPASAKPLFSVLPGSGSVKKSRPPVPKEKNFQATISLKSGENIVVAVKERNRHALLKYSAIVCASMQQYIANHALPKHGEKPLFLNLDCLGKTADKKGYKSSDLIGFGSGSMVMETTCKPGPSVKPPEPSQVMPVGLMGLSSCLLSAGPPSSSTSGGSGHGSLPGTALQDPSKCESVNPQMRWSETETKKLLALYRTYKVDLQAFNAKKSKFNPLVKITQLLNRIPAAHKNCEQVRAKINTIRKSLYKACVARDSQRHTGVTLPEPSLHLKELYSLFEGDLRSRKMDEIKDFATLHEELTRGYTPPAADVPVKEEVLGLPYEILVDVGAVSSHQGRGEHRNTDTRTTPVADAHHDYSCSSSPRKRRRRRVRGKELELETIKHVQNMMVQSDQRLNDTLLQLHAENKRIMEKLIARL
ncbi:uncharacterized protein LOC135501857 isoform X1 [Lineus longissimus]|uniref:uncharacterized protein LOC135501857 isoform X1 n=1 Tax=Lineus longissimus TaxID=88925 RepID=UPI00315D3487